MYNVEYDRGDGTKSLYLGLNVRTEAEAQLYADRFNEKYHGKPYPNGKGFYPFGKAYVVSVTEGLAKFAKKGA